MNKKFFKLASFCFAFILIFATVGLSGCNNNNNNSGSNSGSSTPSTTEFTINYEYYSLYVGETILLKTNYQSVTWTSSNTYIATISSRGTVTAISKGTTRITAKNSQNQKVYCDITVMEKPNTSQEIFISSSNIKNYASITVTPISSNNQQSTFKATISLAGGYKVKTTISLNISVRLTIKYSGNYGISTAYKTCSLRLTLYSSNNSDSDTATITYNYSNMKNIDYSWIISSCYGKIVTK